MRQALTMDVLATDLADYLVRKGVNLTSYPASSHLINLARSLSVRPTIFPAGQLRLRKPGDVR